jgi:hypothetical protein
MSSGHFDVDEWIDFARGLGSHTRRNEMQLHVEMCAACRETASLFGKIWETAHEMAKDSLPQGWLQRAEQIFADQMLQPLQSMDACIAVLAFDSLSAATPENVRTGSHPGRHMLYHTANCALYMKLDEGQTDPAQVSIVGQITDRGHPERAISNTPIFLLNGNKVLVTTSSNEFGEFQLACKTRRRLQISFPFDGSRIDVKLDDVLKEFRHS